MAKKDTPEHVLERRREYYKRNKVRLLKAATDRYHKIKHEIKERHQQRMIDDPDYAQKKRDYHREYYHRVRKHKPKTTI